MKVVNISIFFLLLFNVLIAQERDLNYFLNSAKANSPLINADKNAGIIADLDLQQIKAVLTKPDIGINSEVLFAPILSHDNNLYRFNFISNGADNYTGYDLAATDGGQYQALVSIEQPLFTKSQLMAYGDWSGITKQINENNISLTIHEIEQLVTYQYILCLKSEIQIENSLFVIDEIKQQVLILQKLVENAVYKQTDLMLLQLEQQNFTIEYQKNKAEFRDNLYDLNLICGISDTTLIDIQQTELRIKPEITEASHFLSSYKLDSLLILADQEISGLKYKPQIHAFANAGLNAVYIPAINRLGFSVGLSFSWNIYDGNQMDIQREKSVINLKTSEFEKTQFLTQHDIYKNKLLSRINSTNQILNLMEEQINNYEDLLKDYSIQLSQGEISVMDYKNLLIDISSKKQEYNLLKMETLVLINSYNYWNY